MRAYLLAVLLGLTAIGCRSANTFTQGMAVRALRPPTSMICRDGRPVRVIVGSTCGMGICGWSCAPGRWTDEP